MEKHLIKRCCAVVAAAAVAAFTPFMVSSVPVHADTSDLWDSEIEAWLAVAESVAQEQVLQGNTDAFAWWTSLNYINYALFNDEFMIHAGDTMNSLSPSCGYYYNNQNQLRLIQFPDLSTLDTTTRYSGAITVCKSNDFYITVGCSGNTDAAYYSIQFLPGNQNIMSVQCWHRSNTAENYDLTVTIRGGSYFSSEYWDHTISKTNNMDASYSVYFRSATSSSIPTITPSFTPQWGTSSAILNLAGNLQTVDTSVLGTDYNLQDIALYQLAVPATLHDYLTDDWVPAFETAFPNATLPAVPDLPQDPTETTTSGTGSGCNCNVTVEVNVDPTLELPSEWNEDIVDLETQHYTAPYSDMVISPWSDLQSYYTETVPTRAKVQKAGESDPSDGYEFIGFVFEETAFDCINDYLLAAENLFQESGIKATVIAVLSAGFVIRFISLK